MTSNAQFEEVRTGRVPVQARAGSADTGSVGSWLVPLLLIVGVFQNYYDLESIMWGEGLVLYRSQGPILLKSLKDVTYVITVIAILAFGLKTGRNPVNKIVVAISAICFFLFLASLYNNDIITAAIGLRWAMPLVIFLIAGDWMRHFRGERSVKFLFVGMGVCLAIQVYQLFYMPPVFGQVFGLSARTPGFFIAPNTTGFFGCAAAAFVMVYTSQRFLPSLMAALLALAIAGLAQSGAGIIVAMLLLARAALYRAPIIFWSTAIIVGLIVIPNLNSIMMRDGFIEDSGGGRISILLEIVRESAFSVTNFGYYTNASRLAAETGKYTIAVDSLVASWIGNFGLLAPVVLILLVLFVKREMSDISFTRVVAPLTVFVLFSLSTITFEAYPMNILLVLALWGARKHESDYHLPLVRSHA